MSDFIYHLSEDSDFLVHHGIKGQKWGERRFQNPDGTLTPEGKERYKKYVKEFGEQTANRLMKDINKGISEEKALKREYNRRNVNNKNKFNKIIRPVSTTLGAVGGGVAGGIIGYNNQLSPGPIKTAVAGAIIGGAVNDTIGRAVLKIIDNQKTINKISNEYTDYDLSIDGLIRFKRKMDKFKND